MSTSFNKDSWTQNNFLKKPEIERSFKDGKMYETHKIDGKVARISVFEDLNGDNQFTENEISQVQQYSYRKDGTVEKRITYYDENHDGYSDDKYIVDKYDEYGNFDRFSTKKNKSIVELKFRAAQGRCCDETALNNRKMTSHKDGNDHLVCY